MSLFLLARHLNQKCGNEMDQLLEFFDSMDKRLSRPVKDLDDVRAHMGALQEIREGEIKTDMTITPIEEAYTMLNKYNLIFNDGNAEKVDTLSYQWNLLKQQAYQVQNHLLNIQPEYKADLLEKVEIYQRDQTEFVSDYAEK